MLKSVFDQRLSFEYEQWFESNGIRVIKNSSLFFFFRIIIFFLNFLYKNFVGPVIECYDDKNINKINVKFSDGSILSGFLKKI